MSTANQTKTSTKRAPVAGDDPAPLPTPPDCCPPAEQRSCCEPDDKDECCGNATGGSCGCR